jgi:hypothetical protein
MPQRHLDPMALGPDEDWAGNNAAFRCPVCTKVFLVSGLLHRNGRRCPSCGDSTAFCSGGKGSGGTASIEW